MSKREQKGEKHRASSVALLSAGTVTSAELVMFPQSIEVLLRGKRWCPIGTVPLDYNRAKGMNEVNAYGGKTGVFVWIIKSHLRALMASSRGL